MTIDKIALGQFEIHGLRDGFFRLDGGGDVRGDPQAFMGEKIPG